MTTPPNSGPRASQNPYAPPTASEPMARDPLADEPFGSVARRVFLAWEKLRIVYVGILGAITVGLVVLSGHLTARVVFVVLAGAVAANVLFLAGPAVETYLQWLGYRVSWPRWTMFICGTLLSMILTAGVLLGALGPHPF